MREYVKNTHNCLFYENGKSEPHILVESVEDDDFICYCSDKISSTIVNYDGEIPSSKDRKKTIRGDNLLVWHLSEDVEKPLGVVVREYPSIESYTDYVDGETSIKDAVSDWSDKKDISKEKYEERRSKFLSETTGRQHPYCSCLLTCNCGVREVFQSVSEALGNRYQHSKEGAFSSCQNTKLWYLCGRIDDDIREESYADYEASRTDILSLLSNIYGKYKEPISEVPILYTPYSIALQKVGAYDVRNHRVLEEIHT